MSHVRTSILFALPLVLTAFVACGGSDDDSSLSGTATGGASGAGGGKSGAAGQSTGGSAGKAGGAGGASGGSAGNNGGTGGSGKGVCGNGKVEKDNNEDCDDGNKVAGDGCEADCTATCFPGASGDAKCDDKNPCNGAETCVGAGPGSAVCKAGAPLAEGAACGMGKVCLGGVCASPSCGDGKTQAGEECDDGNVTAGDGCEKTCAFTCKTGDPTRDCKSTNACVADGTCQDATTHTCKAGAAKPLGTACGSGQICNAGTCKASICGDGFVNAATGEECDDGNTVPGDGCEPNCKASCKTPATDCPKPTSICEVAVCNGAKCGTQPDASQDGKTCGNGLACAAGKCVAAGQICGNGTLEAGEVCDDGNTTAGDGCEPDCKYTCAAAATDCPAPPACQSAVCVDVAGAGGKVGQKCGTQADAAVEGQSTASCAAPSTCKSGACTAPGASCGNGVVEAGEACDFGAQNGAGAGCETNCQPSCAKAPDSCPDQNVCNGTEACADVTVGASTGAKCGAGTQATDGTPCGSGNLCFGGQCKVSTCGDGFVDAAGGEECDFGAQNAAGSGCETNCKFSCTKSPDSCVDANACNGVEACGTVNVGGGAGQACTAGTPLALGASCGAGLLCLGAPLACVASSCGDSYVDAGAGEQCDPPNGTTCDAQCKTVVVAACGNNVVEGNEECDDGNTANLDGCDSGCKYEMVMRLTAATISNATAPAGCMPTSNVFGKNVLASAGRSTVNDSLKTAIDDGSTNVIMQALGLDDLTGVADPSFKLGIIAGTADPAKGAWPGGAPIDWWFLAASSNVDAAGLPTSLLQPASVAARKMQAGPGDMTLTLLLAGTPAPLSMRSAQIFATFDGTPAPNKPAAPPTNLKAGLTAFQTVTANASGTQGLCGNITVESLAQIPVPQALTTGTGACNTCNGSHKYTYCGMGNPVSASCNSLLDAIVGGCKATFLCVGAINSTQPDVAGAGFSGALTVDTNNKNKVPAAQVTGNTRAYSSYITFTANRAHLTGKN